MAKRERDPSLDIFDRGLVVLRQEGRLAGHVATTLGTFRTPFRPFTKQDWVWLLVVWADGARERPFEDYPPWTTVKEMRGGVFTWDEGDRRATYNIEWVPEQEREAEWARLGISLDDF